jgi:micrococcal nuclease
MGQSEHGRIRNLLTDRCPDQIIAPWPETRDPGPPITTPPTTIPPATQPPSGNCDPSYADVCIPPSPPDLDCGEITFRLLTVLPPDRHRFDGDYDGIGCES